MCANVRQRFRDIIPQGSVTFCRLKQLNITIIIESLNSDVCVCVSNQLPFYELKMCLVRDQVQAENFQPGFFLTKKKFHIELFSNSGTKWQLLGVFVLVW